MKLVLIVEDNETCAETLQIALESLPDVEVRVLHSPAAALTVLREHWREAGALVTDLHMPQNDGMDLIRNVRSAPGLERLPIVLISGDSDPRLPARAEAQGADAFFAKPYSPAAVRRKLEQLLWA